jgi:hypothetical protein
MKRLHRTLLVTLLLIAAALSPLPGAGVAQLLVGGAAYQARENIQAAQSRFTLVGDSLTNMPVQTNRMAHAILKGWAFGGDITAVLEPKATTTGSSTGRTLLDHSLYEASDTNNSGNQTNLVDGTNSYMRWGAFTNPTPAEYFGVPVEGYNWYWDGTLKAFASGSPPPSGALGCLGRTLCRASNPISGSVNTFGIFGNNPMVFRHIYYGAANIRSGDNQRFYNGSGPSTLGDFDLTIDARPYYSEGDKPDTAASPRTGGYRRGAVNALWPDTRATAAIGGGTTSYWADVEALGASGAIAADGSTNVIANFGFRCAPSGSPLWIGGVQFEVVGASSWSLGGVGLNNPSDATLQKQFDNGDWLTFRDVTTLDPTLPGTFVVIVDPESLPVDTVQAYAEALVDKVTAADHMIGNPTPIVLFVIWPKTSARSVAEMSAWSNGIIAACRSRSNAGYINLFDYYGQAVPAHIDADGTHPDDEASADALAADIWTLLIAAASRDSFTLDDLAAAVWARPTAQITDSGSIGVQVTTNLDAAVSSRSTFDDTTDLVTANVTQVSGDATAADNLEAVLDGTGANIKFNTLTGSKVVITQTTPGDNAVVITANGAASAGIVINATDAMGSGIIFNTGLDTINLDGADMKTLLNTINTGVVTNADSLNTVNQNVDTLEASATTITGNLSNLQTSLNSIAGAGFDAGTDSLEAITNALGTVGANVDAVLTDTGTTLPAQFAALNDLSAAEVRAEIDANSTQLAAIKAKTDDIAPGGGAGSGDTLVNHNTPTTDNLRATSGGVGLDNVTIRAYLKSEYDSNPLTATLRGTAVTSADGRWVTPLMLDSGLAYTLVYSRTDLKTITKEVTIP